MVSAGVFVWTVVSWFRRIAKRENRPEKATSTCAPFGLIKLKMHLQPWAKCIWLTKIALPQRVAPIPTQTLTKFGRENRPCMCNWKLGQYAAHKCWHAVSLASALYGNTVKPMLVRSFSGEIYELFLTLAIIDQSTEVQYPCREVFDERQQKPRISTDRNGVVYTRDVFPDTLWSILDCYMNLIEDLLNDDGVHNRLKPSSHVALGICGTDTMQRLS